MAFFKSPFTASVHSHSCSAAFLSFPLLVHKRMQHNNLQFEIRQLRAHLAQQDLDLAVEREAAMQIHHVWGKQGRSFQVVEGLTPGESDDEGGQRNPREPNTTAGMSILILS